MKRKTRDKICSQCFRPGYRFQGERWLCARHFRFGCMKATARQKGKRVPTTEELKILTEDLEDRAMKCEACGTKTHWSGERGDLRTISLQHDRSGKIRLICMGCNQRHDDLPGDSFYELPKGHWRCPRCEKTKPLAEFYVNSKTGKRDGAICKSCRKIVNKEMWAKYGKQWAANSKRRKQGENH